MCCICLTHANHKLLHAKCTTRFYHYVDLVPKLSLERWLKGLLSNKIFKMLTTNLWQKELYVNSFYSICYVPCAKWFIHKKDFEGPRGLFFAMVYNGYELHVNLNLVCGFFVYLSQSNPLQLRQ